MVFCGAELGKLVRQDKMGDEMARKSRKQSKNMVFNKSADDFRQNQVGIYARLSVEDNGYGTKDSIQNQVAMLKEYVEMRENEFCLAKIYVDNGTTGTHFDRKEWNRLIEDMKGGMIDCIVVKDFSRLGRNYIEVGNYLEKVFPFLGVRVVAVNENYDSEKVSFENSMLMNSLINIVNEYYARDISRKVTQSIRTMQKMGECASGETAYGYKKSSENGKRLVIDAESANIVKKIFEWRLQKKGCTAIANYLNELALPSPGMYRYMNGNPSFKRSSGARWNTKHVAGILTNPVYLGHMVQGKTRRSYFEQGGKMRILPKENWTVVNNTHESLVTQEQFDIAAGMAKQSRKKHMEQMNANKEIPSVENPLRIKVFCGQCGGRLTRRSRVKKGIRNYSYFCPGPKIKSGGPCKNTYIHEVMLIEAVAAVTKGLLQLYGDGGSGHVMEHSQKECLKRKKENHRRRKELEKVIKEVKLQKQKLYADMKEGVLSLSEYEHEKNCLVMVKNQYEKEMDSIANDNEVEEETGNGLEGLGKEVPVDMLCLFIEKIVVHSSDRVEIIYAFEDELSG